NFINVTGAILASVMFAVVVAGTKKIGFLPDVPVTDRFAEGILERQELVRGRPVYFKVGDLEVGQVPTEDAKKLHVFHHLFGAPPEHPPPDIEFYRAVNVGEQVIVKYYRMGDVDHYELRPANEPMEEEYDARPLPRFLFFGAGLLTFGVLLILRRRVGDLTERGVTLLRSVFVGPRFTPDGLDLVPGDGPVVLLIETTDPNALRAICAAID